MNLKKDDVKKPWEEISIDEIQPYPPKYTKMIILSYFFIFFNIFVMTIFVKLDIKFLLPFLICVNGILIFAQLYYYSNGRLKTLLENLKSIIIIVSVFVIIINVIPFIKNHITLGSILMSFYLIFVLILLLFPSYLSMSDHPRSQKHGIILNVISFIYICIIIYF